MMSNRLREFRDLAGLSMQALADRVGTTASQINKLEKGERRLTLDWMTRLSAALGIEPKDLLPLPNRPLPAAPTSTHLLGGGEAAPGPTVPARDPRDLIPVRSAARGGDEQEMFLEDGPIDYIARPHSLLHVRDAYPIYMVGDSMEPRYEQGWLLHVNPFKPPTRGRDVVVYKTGQAVLIKQFVRWEPDALQLRQLNPPQELQVPREEVVECLLVVGVDQEG